MIKYADNVDGQFKYRFSIHPRFSYWTLNVIQRKRFLQQTGIYLKQNPGDVLHCSRDLDDPEKFINVEQNRLKLSRYTASVLGANAYWQKQKEDLKTVISKLERQPYSLLSHLQTCTGQNYMDCSKKAL